MNAEVIKVVGTRLLGRSALLLKKFAPEILTGIGIVGGVTAAVMGAKATNKIEEALADSNKLIANRKEYREMTSLEEYPQRDYQKDLTIAYGFKFGAVIRTYGPAISLGVASIGCILAGHGMLVKRNAALIAAYNAVDAAFKAYRSRVVEEYGEEKDRMFYHGVREETVEVEGTNGKKSKQKTIVHDPNHPSMYARTFAEGNPDWQPNIETNIFRLKLKQTYLNDMLHTRGHLFLNEAYDELGFERTPAGSQVGWFIGQDSDCYVDLGIADLIADPWAAKTENASVVVDFNVDGVMWDKI